MLSLTAAKPLVGFAQQPHMARKTDNVSVIYERMGAACVSGG